MKKPTNNRYLRTLACLTVLSTHANCLAAETTVNTAETTTQGPITPELNGGDALTVSPTGSIRVTANNASGISAAGGGNTINNYGTITTSGSVVTPGSDVSGIYARGGSTTIINNGTIETYGDGRLGGDNASGINALGGGNTIINTGIINTYGNQNARGIRAAGGRSTIINSGSITSFNSTAISAQDGNNSVTNTGSITALGNGANGINALGGSNIITNTGSIISHSGNSIVFTGSGNTLNLGTGSFLSGNIDLGTSTQINITSGADYSKLINYTGALSGISASGPVPVFTNASTKQIATFDPTPFAASSDSLGDMTSTISSLTPKRFNGTDTEHPLWVRGFGMSSSYAGSDATLSRNYVYSGVAIGYDLSRSASLRFGAFGGYGQTSLTTSGTSMQSYNNSSDDGFLGLYGQKHWKNLWLDFGLYGGAQNYKQQRYVNDNLAYLGNSSTNASYQGWWIAPEAGITAKTGEIQGWSILPTARLRYAQQWIGSYTESDGGTANATVNSRSIGVGQAFIGVGTRKTVKTTLGTDTKMVLEGQVGYVYRGTTGSNTVGVTMIGQSLSLPTEASNRNGVAVSAGVSIDLSKAVALKIKGEAGGGSGINYVAGGWAGIDIKF